MFSKTVKDIAYENLNFAVNPAVTGVGGRPFFARRFPTLSDAILLKNTSKGSTWNAAAEVRRPFSNGVYLNGSYSYGVAKSVMDGTSDQAASNWGNVYTPGDPNNVPLARSNFDPGHRFTLMASYEMPFAKVVKPVVSVFYPGTSGRPYTLTYNNDANGDNRFTNDLVYIPTASDPLTYTGGTYNDLLLFIQGDPCLAEYIGTSFRATPAGCRGRTPWTPALRSSSRSSATRPRSRSTHQSDQHARREERSLPVRAVRPGHAHRDRADDRHRDGAADRLQHHVVDGAELHALPARRPPLALADSARRARAVLRTLSVARPVSFS